MVLRVSVMMVVTVLDSVPSADFSTSVFVVVFFEDAPSIGSKDSSLVTVCDETTSPCDAGMAVSSCFRASISSGLRFLVGIGGGCSWSTSISGKRRRDHSIMKVNSKL